MEKGPVPQQQIALMPAPILPTTDNDRFPSTLLTQMRGWVYLCIVLMVLLISSIFTIFLFFFLLPWLETIVYSFFFKLYVEFDTMLSIPFFYGVPRTCFRHFSFITTCNISWLKKSNIITDTKKFIHLLLLFFFQHYHSSCFRVKKNAV